MTVFRHAVKPVPDPEFFFVGFDMDVAHAHLRRPEQNAVHEFHDRRFNLSRQRVQLFIFDHLEFIDRAVNKVVEIIDVHLSAGIDIIHEAAAHRQCHPSHNLWHPEKSFSLLWVAPIVATPPAFCRDEGLCGGAIIFFDRLNDGAFGCHDSFDIIAGHEFDVVDGKYIGGIDHGDGNRGAGAIDGHDAVFLGYFRGNMFYDGRIDLEFAKVDIRDAVLFAQKRHQLVFLHEPHFTRIEPSLPPSLFCVASAFCN